jgi:outer membrane protein assembly factor BamE (lipoprotein component of BamABCDE complex)
MQGNKVRGGLSRPSGRAFGGALVLAAALALSACQHHVDDLGYVPDPDEVSRIKPGLQGRDEVREILGSPSSASTFTDDRWYYISKKIQWVAFFTPDVLDQKVIEVDFDKDGMVSEVRNYSLKDGEQIDPVARKTPSPGRELGFFEQLIGNIGKFNSQQGTSSSNPGPQPGGGNNGPGY